MAFRVSCSIFMTTEQIRIRIAKEEGDRLRKIADNCGISYATLVTVLVKAGCQAVENNGARVSLPLALAVASDLPVATSRRETVAVTKGKEGEVKLPASRQ